MPGGKMQAPFWLGIARDFEEQHRHSGRTKKTEWDNRAQEFPAIFSKRHLA